MQTRKKRAKRARKNKSLWKRLKRLMSGGENSAQDTARKTYQIIVSKVDHYPGPTIPKLNFDQFQLFYDEMYKYYPNYTMEYLIKTYIYNACGNSVVFNRDNDAIVVNVDAWVRHCKQVKIAPYYDQLKSRLPPGTLEEKFEGFVVDYHADSGRYEIREPETVSTGPFVGEDVREPETDSTGPFVKEDVPALDPMVTERDEIMNYVKENNHSDTCSGVYIRKECYADDDLTKWPNPPGLTKQQLEILIPISQSGTRIEKKCPDDVYETLQDLDFTEFKLDKDFYDYLGLLNSNSDVSWPRDQKQKKKIEIIRDSCKTGLNKKKLNLALTSLWNVWKESQKK